MNSVIVGIFDTQSAANNAKNKLLVVGSTSVQPYQQREHEGAISRFFSSIFGSDDSPDEYHATYREAIRRGHYGVSVSVKNEDEQARAESILNDFGAIDTDERSEQWRGEGWVGR